MKKSDGLSLLFISVCCCIFISLGYVNLCRHVARKVNNPNTAEFWQIRNVALDLRNPVKEAREEFKKGNLHVFDASSITDSSNHRVAANAVGKNRPKSMATRGSLGIDILPGFGLLQDPNSTAENLARYHDRFLESSLQFSVAYNRELTRLVNSR